MTSFGAIIRLSRFVDSCYSSCTLSLPMHRNYRVFWHYKIEKYNKCRIWWNCRSCVYLDGRNRRWLRQRKICWRWFVYLWCDSKTCRSCKRKLNILLKGHGTNHGFSFTPTSPYWQLSPLTPLFFSTFTELLFSRLLGLPYSWEIYEMFLFFKSCKYYWWACKFSFYNVKTLCWRIYLDKDIICIREFTGR